MDRLEGCLVVDRRAGSVEQSERTLLAQGIFALALGFTNRDDDFYSSQIIVASAYANNSFDRQDESTP